MLDVVLATSTVVPGAITALLTPASGQLSSVATTVQVGAVIAALTPLIAALHGATSIVVPGATTINVNPTGLTLGVPVLTPIPGPVTLSLQPSIGTLALHAPQLLSPAVLSLSPLSARWQLTVLDGSSALVLLEPIVGALHTPVLLLASPAVVALQATSMQAVLRTTGFAFKFSSGIAIAPLLHFDVTLVGSRRTPMTLLKG
jgi:hypothetical protein